MIELSVATQQRLDLLFAGADRIEAARILAEECAEDLPLWSDHTPTGLERVRFAALRLSGGDLEALRGAVQLAREDWRDVLVAAGFGEHPKAHEDWLPDS